MDELEMQNKKAELIARIPHLDPIHSPKYEEVMEQMNTLVWEEMEDPMTAAPGCSCKTASGVYNIFATKAANELAYEQLKMHEAGHCVLQHFKDNWYKDRQAERQIKSKWSKFKEHIEMEGYEEDEVSDEFIHMIRNVTQDLEINGKYWPTEQEFTEVRERISDASLTRFIEYANEEQLESIEKWMDEKPDEIHQFSKGLYPADFGFPNGLTWMGYLHLILTQPNEFMEQLNNQVDEMQRQQAQQQQQQNGQDQNQQQNGQGQQSQGQQGQGQGSSQGQGQSGGQNSQGQQGQDQNQGLQEDQTPVFNHKPKDGENGNGEGQQSQQGQNGNQQGQNGQNGNGQDQNGQGNGKDKSEENGNGGKSKLKNNGKPDTGKGNEDGNGNGNKMKASVIKANATNGDKGNAAAQARAQAAEDQRNEGQQGAVATAGTGGDDADEWAAPGDGTSEALVDATPTMKLDRSVIKFIEKNCIGKTVQRDRQDPLYNYNRGKTSGGVMRTRITTVEEYRPGNLVALIDVSGSVNIELVKALLSEILRYKSKFGTKSRIILWDTSLVDDLQLKRSNLEAICCGGGTSIARGIRYAKEKYLKSEQDKLCIISDFEDYLQEWDEELEDIKGDTFGVCWGGYNGSNELISAARNKRQEAAARKMKVINVR